MVGIETGVVPTQLFCVDHTLIVPTQLFCVDHTLIHLVPPGGWNVTRSLKLENETI
jgi:hypothetical protein